MLEQTLEHSWIPLSFETSTVVRLQVRVEGHVPEPRAALAWQHFLTMAQVLGRGGESQAEAFTALLRR